MREVLVDLIGLLGLAMIFYGLWIVYEPAAFIVVGLFVFVGAVCHPSFIPKKSK